MTVKEVYAILKELEDHVEDACCAVTMDPLDVKDLITKLRIANLLRKQTGNMDIFDSYEHVAHYNKKTFQNIK